MTVAFGNTLRAVGRERHGPWAVALGAVLALGWLSWAHSAELEVFVTTPLARIEVARMPSRVSTEIGGRVLELGLALDERVERGQELLVLDGSVRQSELDQQLAKLDVLAARRSGIEAQVAAEHGQRKARHELARVTAEQAVRGVQKAEGIASHQEELSRIAERLWQERIVSQVEAVKAREEVRRGQLAVSDASTELERQAAEHDYHDKVALTHIAELQRQLVELDAERLALGAAVVTARAELSLLRVASPVSGQVGQLATLQVGDVVHAGQVVATIVPDAEVRVVAHFSPARAVGSVMPGQRARVRLEGVAGSEHGTFEAHVARTASEPDAGLIRIELTLDGVQCSGLPLQHGQAATVDIETDRASPWTLLQRSVRVGLGLSRGRVPADPVPRSLDLLERSGS